MFTAESLLYPISAAQPSGADLSFSSELDAIAQARRFDDPSLDQGEWVTQLKEADWPFVVQRCAALLAERSKDLKLGVWLTEAATRQHGLEGLAEGLRVLAGLLEHFWDLGLHPEAEDGDLERRIGNLTWILSRVPALLHEIPVTESHLGVFTPLDLERARQQQPGALDPAHLAAIENARKNSSATFLQALQAGVDHCEQALQALEQAADARLGAQGPGFARAREALANFRHALPRPASPVPAVQETPSVPVAESQPIMFTAPTAPAMTHVQLNAASMTREQAIAQLREIARFFRRTEPHSPVSYFADKAAAVGEQDLHTWLRSVVKDEASMAHIEELLGVSATRG